MDIGVVKVSIPPAHAKGQIERPWKFVSIEFQEYANEHVVILKPKPLSWEQFRTSLATSLASTNGKAFVFVHGYNTTFAEAARKTAQMAVDLEIRITPVMFSWASLGKPWRYADDVENARSAAKYLEEFLEKLASQTGAKEVHLVAHSLGNDPLTTALERMALKSAAQREYAWPFGEVVLAAPDVNRNLFESAVTAFQRIVRHTTSYVSSKDWALKISRFFRPSTTRAGDTSHGITLVPGIDTIDVSAIENISWLETGHGYITENPLVLRDLYDIIKAGLRPSERFGLNPMPHGATLPTYWSFVPMRR
jgi:esterase/lipase superfamily enzyme